MTLSRSRSLTCTKVSNVPDESAVPKCMVAKMYPQNNTSVLPILLRQVYLNEAHFYNDFSVKGGALPRPECLHCGAELSLRKKPKFIFLLENAVTTSPWRPRPGALALAPSPWRPRPGALARIFALALTVGFARTLTSSWARMAWTASRCSTSARMGATMSAI